MSIFSINIVWLWQLYWCIPCLSAQSDDVDIKNQNRTTYLLQLGFREYFTFAKNDMAGLSKMNNLVIKSENRELIPSFYVGCRINVKFGLQSAYNGIWKTSRGAAYLASYYDATSWSFGDLSFLDQLFEAFGMDIPDDYLTQESEPVWLDIADGLSLETWTDLCSVRLSYIVFENRRFRTSFLAGPAIAV